MNDGNDEKNGLEEKERNGGKLPRYEIDCGNGKEGQIDHQNKIGGGGKLPLEIGAVVSLNLDDIKFIIKNQYPRIGKGIKGCSIVVKTFFDKKERTLIESEIKGNKDLNSPQQRINECCRAGVLTLQPDMVSEVNYYSLTEDFLESCKSLINAKSEIGNQQTDGFGISYEECVDNFKKVIRTYYEKEAANLQRSYPDKQTLNLDLETIGKKSIALEDEILNNPIMALAAGTQAINELLGDPQKEYLERYNISVFNLPETSQKQISRLLPEDLNKYIQISGVIEVEGTVEFKTLEATFQCQRCGHDIIMPQDMLGEELKEPYLCESCEKKGPFQIILDKNKESKYKRFIIQENLIDLGGTSQPGELLIECYGEPADMDLGAGDAVKMAGICRKRFNKNGAKRSSLGVPIFTASHIEKTGELAIPEKITEQDIKELRTLVKKPDYEKDLIESTAPHIYGHDHIKLAGTLMQFGSDTVELFDGNIKRGWIHMLLVGNPANAKSEILKFFARNTPHSSYISAPGTTYAGLFGSFEKDDRLPKGVIMRPGAITRSHVGILALDEATEVTDERINTGLLTAMENGSIPLNKMGRKMEPPCRTSIMAAANPKLGTFDDFEPWLSQVKISAPLRSRYDLIFKVVEDPDKIREVAMKIIKTQNGGLKESEIPISRETRLKLIIYGRTINPKFPTEIEEKIATTYINAKETPGCNFTNRVLPSILRLCKARARMFLRDTVTNEDYKAVTGLLSRYLDEFATNENNMIDTEIIEDVVTGELKEKIQKVLMVVREIHKQGNSPTRLTDFEDHTKTQALKKENLQEILKIMEDRGLIYKPNGKGWMEA